MHHPHAPAPHHSRRAFFSSLASAAAFLPAAVAQQRPTAAELEQTFRRLSEDYERKGLAEPFKGVTANGEVVPGLFPLQKTGVSTEPVRNAAERFLASLTEAQRARTMFPVDDVEWRKWMNQHFYRRQGVSFQELSPAQRDAAFGLLRASLSGRGFALTRNIMRLNETLAELSGDHDFLGEWLYHITVMGRPSASEPWGWQLDGHHAIVNYFVLGDQAVMTPHFFGSEPVAATSGKYKGVSILEAEQTEGLRMLGALSEAQRKRAILTFSKSGNNNLGEAFRDNLVLDYAGVQAAGLGSSAHARLLDLVQLYIGNMDDAHARVKMDEIRRHLPDTWFAWIGGTDASSVYYYRIHSPVILIEFDHQRPANLRKFAANPDLPTRQHIHCVVRTPNGNDYGKDLLRQHYLAHPHKT